MTNKLRFSATFLFMFLLVTFMVMGETQKQNPVAVSPGGDTELVTVWQSCPTFSWSSVDQAVSYKIAVFESVDAKVTTYEGIAAVSSPVISQQISGPALSWTLSSNESLKAGSVYVWYVQAVDIFGNAIGSWSNGRIFQVEQEIRFAGIEEKLGEILKSYGVNEETITNVLKEMKSEVKEVVVRSSGSTPSGNNSPETADIQGLEGEYHRTFYGLYAGVSVTIGGELTFIGGEAGRYNTSGGLNTFIGSQAGKANTSASGQTFVGANAGLNNTSGYYNAFFGYRSGEANTTGYENTFIGMDSGVANTTGFRNTFLGMNAGSYNTAANQNTFIGNRAGSHTTTGGNNTFLGYGAGNENNTGEGNLFLGYNAGFNETTSNKLYIANSNTTSPLIYGEFDNSVVSINGKLGIGTKMPTYVLEINSTDSAANFACKKADGATAVIAADSSHVFIGAKSNHDFRLIANDSPKITILPSGYIGFRTTTPDYPMELETTGENAAFTTTRTDGAQNFMSATASYAQFGAVSNHPVRILVNSIWKFMLNTDGSITMANGATLTSGGVWTNASSRALKENIENLSADEAVDALTQLNPVKYNYIVDKTDKHVGFIAEDVPGLVATSDRKGLSPMDVTAVLTKVVQEQQRVNQEQQKIISQLQERIEKLEKK